jgi:hypothetical protein
MSDSIFTHPGRFLHVKGIPCSEFLVKIIGSQSSAAWHYVGAARHCMQALRAAAFWLNAAAEMQGNDFDSVMKQVR